MLEGLAKAPISHTQPHGELSNRKRKKNTKGAAAPEFELNSCPKSCAQICTQNSAKEKQQEDLLHVQKMKRERPLNLQFIPYRSFFRSRSCASGS